MAKQEPTTTVVLDVTLAPSDKTKNFTVFGNGTALPMHGGKCALLTNAKGQVYLPIGFDKLDPTKPIRITITQ